MKIIPPTVCRSSFLAVGIGMITLMGSVIPGAFAQEPPQKIDFELIDPELPDFGAVLQPIGAEAEYRPAAKWAAPFRLSLSKEKPHAGEYCLLWEFSKDSGGVASLRFPVIGIPSGTTRVAVQFFVRTENVPTDGIFSVGQMDDQGAHLKTLYGVAVIPGSNGWASVEWEGELETGTTGLRITVDYKAIPASSKIWLDDLSISPK